MAPPKGSRKRAFKWPKRKEFPTKKRKTPSPQNWDDNDMELFPGSPDHLPDSKIADMVSNVLEYSFERDRDEERRDKGMTFGEMKAYIAEKYKLGTNGVETIHNRLREQLNMEIEREGVIMVTSKKKKEDEEKQENELAKKFKCREFSIVLKDVYEEQAGTNVTMRVELQLQQKQDVSDSEQSSGGKSEQRLAKKRSSRVYLEESE